MKQLTFRLRRSRLGFTLVELLVVIAIITILAAILFPVLSGVREKARQSSCLSNTKQMGLAVMQYTQDFDETFMPGILHVSLYMGWAGQIGNYLASPDVLKCPSDKTKASAGQYVVSYAMNENLLRCRTFNAPPRYQTAQMSMLTAPEKTVFAFEVTSSTIASIKPSEGQSAAGDGSGWAQGANTGGGPLNIGLATENAAGYNTYMKGKNNGILGRHNAGSNWLLADGHVKWLQADRVSGGPSAEYAGCYQDAAPCVAGHAASTDVTTIVANGPLMGATFSTK